MTEAQDMVEIQKIIDHINDLSNLLRQQHKEAFLSGSEALLSPGHYGAGSR
jgi:hypothetical protein